MTTSKRGCVCFPNRAYFRFSFNPHRRGMGGKWAAVRRRIVHKRLAAIMSIVIDPTPDWRLFLRSYRSGMVGDHIERILVIKAR